MSTATITFTDLDQKLRELALTDFEKFCEIVQIDKVQVLICMEKQKGRSVQAIANKVRMPKSTVGKRCKKCPPKADG